MFNPNSINNSEGEHQDNAETEALKTDNINKKLGDLANSRTLNEKLLHEYTSGNLLRADDEVSRDLNLESVGDYLKGVNIDPNLAETLLSSGIFDVSGEGSNGAYRVSIWDEKDKNGQPYLGSTTRDMTGHRFSTGHKYKIFERNDLLVVYDSQTSIRHNEYKTERNQVALIDPDTSRLVALGKNIIDELVRDESSTEASVMSINNENLDDNFDKFIFKITDQEKFDELASKQTEDNSLFDKIKNSVTKQEAEAEEKRRLQEEKAKAKAEKEKLEEDIEAEIAKSGLLESVVGYVKDKRLIMKFVASNKGHVNVLERPMGNYIMDTDLKTESLHIPDGMSLKTRLYGPAEGEREYEVLNTKNKKIGVLDGWE